MAGIYIHIPFCKQACHYCNFHFSTTLHLKSEMVKAICKEIKIRASLPRNGDEISVLKEGENIRTIYFGGGTPSLLTAEELDLILSEIRLNYQIAPDAEITLEANPDDISLEKLIFWKHAGINRLSIGIQSFAEKDLMWMNRVHHADQALNSVLMAREIGFDNFSIDLIFGTPGLTNAQWEKNIETAIELNVPHIAAYALTVEPKTALQKMIALKKKEDINQETQASQYLILMNALAGAGYEHYEISNFARPGFRSKHNSSYWQGESYIGIGPSAHSYNGVARMWNVANNPNYIKNLNENIIPYEKEILTTKQKLEEYIMTAIRTSEGIDLGFVRSQFSKEDAARIEQETKAEIEEGKMLRKSNSLVLTNEGKLFADAISVKLFV